MAHLQCSPKKEDWVHDEYEVGSEALRSDDLAVWHEAILTAFSSLYYTENGILSGYDRRELKNPFLKSFQEFWQLLWGAVKRLQRAKNESWLERGGTRWLRRRRASLPCSRFVYKFDAPTHLSGKTKHSHQILERIGASLDL